MKLKDELCCIEVAALQARDLNFMGLADAFDCVADLMRCELGQDPEVRAKDHRSGNPATADLIGPEIPLRANLAVA